MGLGPLRLPLLLELNTGGGNLPLQRGKLELILAQQGEVPVIGRTQALQQGNDGVMTGRLFPRSMREMVMGSQIPSHSCRWVSPRSSLLHRMKSPRKISSIISFSSFFCLRKNRYLTIT